MFKNKSTWVKKILITLQFISQKKYASFAKYIHFSRDKLKESKKIL